MVGRQISMMVVAAGVVLGGCTAEVEHVGGAQQALVAECYTNSDCPGPRGTCDPGLLHCVSCTGDLNYDLEVDAADQTLYDDAYSTGHLTADINKDWLLDAADQTLLNAAKAANDCTCNPELINGAYTHNGASDPGWKYQGQQFVIDIDAFSALGISRLLPVVTQGDACDATVIWDDGYEGPAIVGTNDDGTLEATVRWRAQGVAPGHYSLGLIDIGTGRLVAENLVTLEVRARRSGGGGRTLVRMAVHVQENDPR